MQTPNLAACEKKIKTSPHPHSCKTCIQGTNIIPDEWRAYRTASANMGYKHFTVNHSQWFVDPHSGAHSQHMERAWLTYKTSVWRLRENRTENMLKHQLSLIEWTRWLGEKN